MRYLLPLALGTLLLCSTTVASTDIHRSGAALNWVASWTTAIAYPYEDQGSKPEYSWFYDSWFYDLYMHPESAVGLPNAQAVNQTFRMTIRPDIWGNTIRIRFSNVFGDREIRLSAAAVGLQESSAQILPGTNVAIKFGGSTEVIIPKGQQVFSDSIHLAYVTEERKFWLRGRNLAVSFAISGKSGLLSSHTASVYSYISRPNSGNLVQEEDDEKFPFVTKNYFLISELDVLADADTKVVCAFGDSITDGGTTVNGYDGWSDVLARRLHRVYGDKVSVVNMAIGGNAIVASLGSTPAVDRVDRDILGISGLTSVIWLEGINDLGGSNVKLDELVEGIKRVVAHLHDRGIRVSGATLTSSAAPELADRSTWRKAFDSYHSSQVNDERKKLNIFILNSGLFDGVIDMSSATESPQTGALYEGMHVGDYLHPNRAGHQAMAEAIDINHLMRPPLAEPRSQKMETGMGRAQ